MNKEYIMKDKHIIKVNFTLREALEVMNSFGERSLMTLFIVDTTQKLIGSLTDGDIRRALVEGIGIEDSVSDVMQRDFKFFTEGEMNLEKFIEFKNKGLKLIPIVEIGTRKIVNLIDISKQKSFLPMDALIMAGGKGARLRPLTLKTPKPLLKIGDKPIIEYNVDRLNQFGVKNLNISVKYLGKQVEDYFKDGAEKGMNISYLWEDEPLGTIGVAYKIKELRHDYLLVMNSDLLTNIDFEDMFKAFLESDADMIVATIPYEVNVPYAVLETKNNTVTSLKEKPTYTYYSNAGIYILKKSALKHIPEEKLYNATDLLEDIIKSNGNVVHYAILGYWLDIGKPQDFEKAQKDFNRIKW